MASRIIAVTAAGMTPRRRFSDDDKARLVSEALAPGSSVAVVGRRHGICTSLIYRWRRVLLCERPAADAATALPAPAFVPVEVTAASHAASLPPASPLPPGALEITTGSGSIVRLAPPIDARVLRLLVDTLR